MTKTHNNITRQKTILISIRPLRSHRPITVLASEATCWRIDVTQKTYWTNFRNQIRRRNCIIVYNLINYYVFQFVFKLTGCLWFPLPSFFKCLWYALLTTDITLNWRFGAQKWNNVRLFLTRNRRYADRTAANRKRLVPSRSKNYRKKETICFKKLFFITNSIESVLGLHNYCRWLFLGA